VGLSSCVRLCRSGLLSELLSLMNHVRRESSWLVTVYLRKRALR